MRLNHHHRAAAEERRIAKGKAGGSYGFQAITDIGAALEQAAESADTDASRKWVGELSRYLDRVEIIFD